ncbi:MAG: hypothetical protein F6K48_03150 [Okeania sp. SIO3H1]|nr:hypothetical protein [Okeania sp. SIO3H1]
MNYSTIVQRVRKAVPKDYARIKRLPRKAQQLLLQKAMQQLATFPPEIQAVAKDIIQRENARGVPYSGIGSSAVSTAANIATVVGTIGQIGLSIYSLTENRKMQKKADERASREQQMNELLLMEQMKTIAQNRELQRKQAEQAIAAQQAEINAMERLSQQAAQAPQQTPTAPQQALPQPTGAAPSNTGLLVAGGVAAAAVAAVALSKG